MGGRGCENQIIIRPGSAQLETVAEPQSAWEQVTGHLLAALQPPSANGSLLAGLQLRIRHEITRHSRKKEKRTRI